MEKKKYKCPECGHICTEDEMLADSTDGEAWSNWICPKCKYWQISLEDWIKIKPEPAKSLDTIQDTIKNNFSLTP